MTKKATKKRMPANKIATKKKIAKKVAPKKKTVKKTVLPKKSANTISNVKKITGTKKENKGKSSRVNKNTNGKNVVDKKKSAERRSTVPVTSKKASTKRPNVPVEEPENNLPPVEEKSPAITPEENPVIAHVPGMDNKTNRKEAIRHYDNHNIKLSSVSKSKMRPAGKKPLW